MNTKTSISSFAILALLAVSVPLSSARASFPNLTLSSTGSLVQALVSNADPNSPVNFHYPNGTVVIGNTDGSGYLTANIVPGTYHLSLGNPVYVVVNGTYSPTATWPAVSGSSSGTSLYLTQTTVTVNTGQSTSVAVSNFSNDLSLPGNTNPAAVSASISGSTINITGLSIGTAVLTVCSTSSGCANINVTVQSNSVSSPAVYLNPGSVSLNVSQSQAIAITGYASGPYYVSTNSNTSAVSAAISSSNLILTGLSSGASNVTVCATGGQCGTAYATVNGTGSNGSTNMPLALQSITMASNGVNGTYASAGNVVTISFAANQPIINPQLNVNGQNVLVSGSGNGPYTASYSVSGNPSTIPVSVSFANSSGTTASASFSIGNNGTSIPVPSPSPIPTTPTSSSYTFNKYLYMGMNKLGESDPDVVALQQRLKTDGFLAGAATGYFGPQTKAAVIAYQKAHKLSALGVVGPATRDLLSKGI